MSRLQLSWQEHHSTLVSLVQTFWGNDLLVDCTLAAEGKYLKAHKIILSACSPYFQLLFSQENEKNPIVILKDVQFECLKSVLDFVYFGEVLVRESQLSTFLEVARSLQIKGLDSNDKEASQKKAHSTRTKTKDSTSRPVKYEVSEEVIDVEDDCKIVRVVDRITEASSSQPSHAPSPSEADDAGTITIESAYSIATSARSSPELGDSVNTEAPECLLDSAPPSVASSVPDSADAVQSSKVLESNNLKSDPDKNSLIKESSSVSGTGNNLGESSVFNSFGTDEGANNGVTPGHSDDNSSGKRRKQSSSTGPAKRRVLNQSDPRQKSFKLQLSRTELATTPGKVTPSERSKEAISVSSEDAAESSKEAESTTPKSSVNSGEALSRVLSIVLSKAKIPASVFVPNKSAHVQAPSPSSAPSPSAPAPSSASAPAPTRARAGIHPPITYSGPNAKRKRRYLKRHTCPDCNKQFLRPSYLLIHRRRHTGEKPHICPICKKCFAQPGALKRHGTLHTGERPYTCEYCLKSFNRSSTLKIHLRLHTGERPYECPDCGKTFVAHSQLWSHKRVHMEGNYKCDACGESFKRKPLLIQHWFLVHEKGEVIHTIL